MAQCSIDLEEATLLLKDRVTTLHLSDYLEGNLHLDSLNKQDIINTCIEEREYVECLMDSAYKNKAI